MNAEIAVSGVDVKKKQIFIINKSSARKDIPHILTERVSMHRCVYVYNVKHALLQPTT